MQENTRNHKIIASLDIYDYIIITFFVALFALVFIRNYQLKDAKLPCIFALQTEKLEQMQEGEPVKIRGKLKRQPTAGVWCENEIKIFLILGA